MNEYYNRQEVSNSDLTWLQKYWMPEHIRFDIEKAFADGTLIDTMITESHRVDYFKHRIFDYNWQFTSDDFERAKEMKKAFFKDPFCAMIAKQSTFQKVSVQPNFEIDYCGFKFNLAARCKWDLFVETFDLSGDIKSTACTTQSQCEEAVRYFDYDRSRAWYMDIEERSNDMIIFISKKNFRIFKIPVKRDKDIYVQGKKKYEELAFRYFTYFGDLKQTA